MSFNQILEKILLFNRVKEVLVCEVDALGMRASVLVKQGNTLNVSLEAHADALDLAGGVAELVQQLRKQGWTGRHAILLNPAVVQQLIELPIPPKNKLAPQQIAESVRWELEPYLTQQITQLSVGEILLQNKHINAEQVEEILNQQAIANTSKNREVLYKQFGELAVELGYATRSNVDKALSKQSWFIAKGEEMQCGWVAQSAQPNPETQLYSWLAVGMNKQLLRLWQAAFSAQGVKLESAYPVVGNAIASIDAYSKQANAPFNELVFEVHEAQLMGAHLQNGQLKALHPMPLRQDQALTVMSDMFQSMGHEHVDRVSLVDAFSRSEMETSRLVDDFQQVIGLPVKAYGRLGHSTNQGLKAAAMHYLFQKINVPLAAVPVGEPLAPLMQRPAVRAGMGGLIILGLLGMAEATLQVRQFSINHEKEIVDKDLAKIKEAIARIQAKVDEVKNLKDGIKNKQDEIKALNRSIALISVDLPKRNQTVNSFLSELNRTVSEDVVIDRITEDAVLGFSISAWSISEQSAQEFVKNLQLAIHPLGYKLKDITVTAQTGRLGLLGSAINFNATTLSDEVWKNIKQNNPQMLSGTASASSNNAIKAGQ
jgi:hypothetical protein